MKVLIVEDEALVARRLTRLVASILGERLTSLEVVMSLSGAAGRISKQSIDLLFLDLNLNGEDGFDLLTRAAAGSFQTVIVSAYTDQAVRAFEYGVIDFVPKPFGEERLRRAIERVKTRESGLRQQLRFLSVRKGDGIHLVPIDEVKIVRGADDYSELVCQAGETHLHDKTLGTLETLLPDRFMRVHRSYIVDVARARQIRNEPGSRYLLVLDDGEEVPVSRTKVADLRELIS